MASSAESLAEQLQDFQIQEEEFIEHEIFQRNCYEPLQPIEVPEPLIVDAGANVGLFAFWALKRWTTCRLICIEPLPPSVKILRENLSKAGDRALIVAAALGAKEEVAEFFYFPWAPGESTRHVHEAAEQRERLSVAAAESGVAAPPNLRKLATPQLQESFQCRVQRMSTLMRPLKTRKGQPAYVDLLKVDVEGDEEAVFQGIDAEDWPRIRQVVAEVHDIDGRLQRIQQLLQEKGFVVEIRQQLPCHEEGYFAFIPESLRLFHIRAARRTKRGAPVESAEKRETRAALPEGTPLREAGLSIRADSLVFVSNSLQSLKLKKIKLRGIKILAMCTDADVLS